MRTLLEAVKRAGGIRIRGVDSFHAQTRPAASNKSDSQEQWRGHERVARMNVFAARVIGEDQARASSGKCVAVVGESHPRDHRFGGDRELTEAEVPDWPDLISGLTRYLGVPAIKLTSPDRAISIHAEE